MRRNLEESLTLKNAGSGRFSVSSLRDLDALVGAFVTEERPEIQWSDSHARFRFETEQEAREAVRDAYHRNFFPNLDWDTAGVQKVCTFPPYSTDLEAAWLVVERLSQAKNELRLKREAGQWIACFGQGEPVAAPSAPAAICLAGLRNRGIEVTPAAQIV